MNGYSRIRKVDTTKSKSVNSENPSFPHHIPRSKSTYSNPNFKSLKTIQNHYIAKDKTGTAMHNPSPKHENVEEGTGEVLGTILSRKFPISSAHSYNVSAEQHSSSFQTNIVNTSLSMKRSTSSSEGYCRIHHQCDLNDKHAAESISQKICIKKKGTFFKSFRSLFGL